uniref:Uncharacterized protein n=1 Tax=Ixodes ricinus TaxID=34613 RepID=A0A147BRA0_IXORI
MATTTGSGASISRLATTAAFILPAAAKTTFFGCGEYLRESRKRRLTLQPPLAKRKRMKERRLKRLMEEVSCLTTK